MRTVPADEATTRPTRPTRPTPPRLSGTELFFVIYLSFGTGQLFTNFVHYDLGKYIFADYGRLLILSVWWYLLVSKRALVKRLAFPTLVVLAAILLIEVYHVSRIGIGTGGVTGIKAILYNPMYASLINLVMFVLILHEYRVKRMLVIKYVVLTASWLTLVHIMTWVGVITEILPVRGQATAIQVLNNNTLSYVSCFVLYCLHFTSLRESFSRRSLEAQTLIALLCVLVNTTRGAIILLAIYALVLAFRAASTRLRIVGLVASAITLAIILDSWNSNSIRAYHDVFETLSSNIDVQPLSNLSARAGSSPPQSTALLGDDQSDAFASAAGRVFANVMAYKLLMLNALLGVGTFSAYAIDAYGAGIHSLPFLYAVSSGIVGVALLVVLFGILSAKRSNAIWSHALYLLPVGLFLNMFPLWYACCFFLGKANRSAAD